MNSQPTPVSHKSSITALRNWPWRPILACGGALLIGRILMPFALHAPAKQSQSGVSAWQIALPVSSTLVVSALPAAGQTTRGEVRLVADVMGKTPIGGEVARWLVEPGTRVEKGQPVVEISSGQSSRAVPRAEAAQSEAEKQQIAASNAQFALAQQLATSQIKLRAAKDRVDRAQARVSEAREIIQKLQRGEEVRLPNALAPTPEPTSPRLSKPARQAMDRAKAAQEAATQAADALTSAKREVDKADKDLRDATSRLKDAQKAQEKAEDMFDADRATGSQVQDARSAAGDAKAAVKKATDRLDAAQKALIARTQEATTAEDAAKTADAEAKKLAPSTEDSSTTDPPPSATLNLEQASQLVTDALTESRRATRDAERLHAQVEDYQRQVRTSQNRIKSTSEDLKDAQQRVLDSVPPPQFTAAAAPADGTVTWISRLAREVSAGDSVFGLAQGRNCRAILEDRTDAWKRLRVGQTLPALISLSDEGTASKNSMPNATSNGSTGTNDTDNGANPVKTLPTATASAAASMVANLVVSQINAPESEGEPASIEGQLQAGSTVQLEPGMQVTVSLPGPKTAKTSVVAVPPMAVVQRGDSHFVATLEAAKVDPFATAAPEESSKVTNATNSGSGTSEKTASSPANQEAAKSAKDPNLETKETVSDSTADKPTVLYQLHWREVTLGPGDLMQLQIRSGLKVGERIISDPQPLLAQMDPETEDETLVRISLD